MKNNEKDLTVQMAIIFVFLLVIFISLLVYNKMQPPIPNIETNLPARIASTTNIVGVATTTVSTCRCPAGYIKAGNACNPKCYYSTPKCLAPSFICSGKNTSTCTPKWTCGWGPCVNGNQVMVATDTNNCGLSSAGVRIACPALAALCENK